MPAGAIEAVCVVLYLSNPETLSMPAGAIEARISRPSTIPENIFQCLLVRLRPFCDIVDAHDEELSMPAGAIEASSGVTSGGTYGGTFNACWCD